MLAITVVVASAANVPDVGEISSQGGLSEAVQSKLAVPVLWSV